MKTVNLHLLDGGIVCERRIAPGNSTVDKMAEVKNNTSFMLFCVEGNSSNTIVNMPSD